jgi:hypothetical protein
VKEKFRAKGIMRIDAMPKTPSVGTSVTGSSTLKLAATEIPAIKTIMTISKIYLGSMEKKLITIWEFAKTSAL